MQRSTSLCCLVLILGACVTSANAGVIRFADDPFAGSDALTTAGRQIVGDELFVDFDVANDVFSFESPAFGVSSLGFVNDRIENVPASGANLIVLETFDNDDDLTTPFLAGTAANIIANRIVSPGAGFFVYFNQNLDLPRLVFSTDLDSAESDLKVLARLTNFAGDQGALAGLGADNFQVPEPSSMLLLSGLAAAGMALRRRRAAVAVGPGR